MRYRKYLFALLALATTLVSVPPVARAAAGELALEAISGHELGILRHPRLQGDPARWPRVYLPRFGLNARYNLMRNFALGLGFEGSLPVDVRTVGVIYQGQSQGNLTAHYHDFFVPITFDALIEGESDWSWTAGFAMGLALMHWQDAALQPTSGAVGPALFAPLDQWRGAWFGRVAIGRIWRPNPYFGLHAGGSVGIKQQGDIHVSLFIAVLTAFGDGPQLDELPL